MRIVFLLLLACAGCGEAVRDDHFANELAVDDREPSPVQVDLTPVRIGELGSNFDACNGSGTTRQLDAARGDTLPVRAAPFDNARETTRIAAGATFYVCTRSHDQRWLGVVWAQQPGLDCGVSSPVTSRRDYDGPCASGWVPASFVKLIAG